MNAHVFYEVQLILEEIKRWVSVDARPSLFIDGSGHVCLEITCEAAGIDFNVRRAFCPHELSNERHVDDIIISMCSNLNCDLRRVIEDKRAEERVNKIV